MSSITKAIALKLYEKMVLIRKFDSAALDLYSKNIIKGSGLYIFMLDKKLWL
jgi:TPP-dependent pyruvate/acetoin dehydrogenase alpha subunit